MGTAKVGARRKTLSQDATANPRSAQLLKEWNRELNGALTPEDVSRGARQSVWWRGASCGHEWKARLDSRQSGSGCPYCANRVILPGFNDLATQNPQLAAEWHPTANGTLTPADVPPASGLKVWWLAACSHEWQASVNRRSQGAGCPVCSGAAVLKGETDLATKFPAVARTWHPTRNGDMRPDQVTAGSFRTVWWKCPLNHEWRARVNHRTSGLGCPFCSGQRLLTGFNDLGTSHPQLAREWSTTRNGELRPDAVQAGSDRKVWWTCGSCGRDWKANISMRARRTGCPYCAVNQTSKIEERFRTEFAKGSRLGSVNADHRTRLPVSGLKRATVQVDITGFLHTGQTVAIQYDGSYWHGSHAAQVRDVEVTHALLDQGYIVVRIREIGERIALDPLPIKHRNLHQVFYRYSRMSPGDVSATVAEVTAWLDAIARRTLALQIG